MPTYAIGDVQGCRAELDHLLDTVGFAPARDRLWLVGDLVNRGPDSLGTLRFVRGLGTRAVCVLGNHDLHLLAAAAGIREPLAKDTFGPILAAPDRGEIVEWLRTRPLLHRDRNLGYAMVHAGIPPGWTLDAAEARAREVEACLAGPDWRDLLRNMYGNKPDRWSDTLSGFDRMRFVVNAFTRMRYVQNDGRLDLRNAGPPGTQPKGLVPWFVARRPAPTEERVLFGHWASLPVAAAADPAYRVEALDTGCVWGRQLTALRLDDGRRFAVSSQQPPASEG